MFPVVTWDVDGGGGPGGERLAGVAAAEMEAASLASLHRLSRSMPDLAELRHLGERIYEVRFQSLLTPCPLTDPKALSVVPLLPSVRPTLLSVLPSFACHSGNCRVFAESIWSGANSLTRRRRMEALPSSILGHFSPPFLSLPGNNLPSIILIVSLSFWTVTREKINFPHLAFLQKLQFAFAPFRHLGTNV